MSKIKIISYYLPAYHEIDENNEWYGEGFTEWDNARKGVPLFKNHYQPRTPHNEYFYDLTDVDALTYQANLATENGIFGFAFYHYWFNGRLVFEKPVELLLRNKDIKVNYCFTWANHTWRKTWHDGLGEPELLIEQTYGGQSDWLSHFEYFLEYFKDDRYILVDGRPMIVIFKADDIPEFDKMVDYWDDLAVKNGFKGIYTVRLIHSSQDLKLTFNTDAIVDFEPNKTASLRDFTTIPSFWKLRRYIWHRLKFSNKFVELFQDTINYDSFYKSILAKKLISAEYLHSFFIDWDNSARKGKRALIFKGASPSKLRKYLSKIIKKSVEQQKEYIFAFAWNEWGEGAYLEPDEKFKDQYLRAIHEALKENEE